MRSSEGSQSITRCAASAFCTIGKPAVETDDGQSWSGLATCYEGLGDLGKALEFETMAAHLTTDADTWRNLAEKSKCAIVI